MNEITRHDKNHSIKKKRCMMKRTIKNGMIIAINQSINQSILSKNIIV